MFLIQVKECVTRRRRDEWLERKPSLETPASGFAPLRDISNGVASRPDWGGIEAFAGMWPDGQGAAKLSFAGTAPRGYVQPTKIDTLRAHDRRETVVRPDAVGNPLRQREHHA